MNRNNASSVFIIIAIAFAMVAGIVWTIERYRAACNAPPADSVGCFLLELPK